MSEIKQLRLLPDAGWNIYAKLPHWLLVFIVIFGVLGSLWPHTKVKPFNVYDQPFYIGIANDLLTSGRFTNGYFFQTGDLTQPRASGMRFTPLYPSLLAAAASIDRPFHQGMSCLVEGRGHDQSCPRRASLVRSFQFLMLGMVYWMIWRMANLIAGGRRIAWITLGIALLTAPDLLVFVNYLMTEITTLFLITAASAAAVETLSRPTQQLGWLVASGSLAGLAGLTRPAYFDLFLICCAAGFALALINRRRWRGISLAAAFMLGGSLVTAPWIVRNAIVMDSTALTEGYGAHVLNERIAFDEMTPFEYRLSFLCWLPDGNALGAEFFGPGACHRFQWDDYPDSFYSIGNGTLMRQSLAASGGWPYMVPYLMRTYILSHPLKHALVTISLALRGAYISHYWGLLLLPLCAASTYKAIICRDLKFLAVSLPAWFMLVLSAAVSVNQTRYNYMLIIPFSIAGAMAAEYVILKYFKNHRLQ